MRQVLSSAWALLLGMLLLMVGNGLQGTMMGVRGAIEGFSTFELSLIASAYFIGFLGGSRATPELIRRVGHVRVFAALGSFISAVLILYPTLTDPIAWIVLRVIVGFCVSGVYVTAESWLNNAASNENRGKALSLYMIVQMLGIVSSQALLNLGDPAGYLLFVIPSVLVSISFAPILLNVQPTPAFDTTKPMSLKELYLISPLGFVGMALMGGLFSAQFGMSSVYGTEAGLSVGQIAAFVSSIFLGGMLFQYPIGWLSDRMDRRILIAGTAIIGLGMSLVAFLFPGNYELILAAGFIVGGMANPLYALLIAYTNDYLTVDDMAAASGGLLFVNGLGAIAGPIVTGWAMSATGPQGFWLFIGVMMGAIAVYAFWRMTQRASIYQEEDDYDAVSYAPVFATATPVAVEVAQEYYVENVEGEDVAGGEAPSGS